jgi:predicted dehydrogenase
MVGGGGYGYFYLKTLLEQIPADQARLCGVVDPQARQSGHYRHLIEAGVPIFDEIDEYYQAGYRADLAVIVSPIQFHASQSCIALSQGTHVLCDKPIAPVVQEADRLIEAARKGEPWCMIGYRWSFSRAVQNLKRDIRRGLFGKPLRMKTLIFWPRDDAYYQRNNWAGRIKDDCGRWVLDSPASNAMAHFLHHLFYVLGVETSSSARPEEAVAELYRANPIENFDTGICRAHAECGVEVLFYGSHATQSRQEPTFHLEFENAAISYNEPTPEIVVQTREGRVWSYGSPEDDPQFQKLFAAVRAVHTQEPVVCGPQAARAQCVCINGMQDSVETIESFPHSIIRRDEEKKRWLAAGLDDVLRECYRKDALPSEIGTPWAQRGVTVDLRHYARYPSRSGK